MKERFYFTVRQGRRIYMADFSGTKSIPEALELLQYSRDLVRKEPPHSVYALVRLHDTFMDPQILREIRHIVTEVGRYIQAEAWLGLSAVQRLLFNRFMKMVNRRIYAAKDEEDGLRWLLNQIEEDRKTGRTG